MSIQNPEIDNGKENKSSRISNLSYKSMLAKNFEQLLYDNFHKEFTKQQKIIGDLKSKFTIAERNNEISDRKRYYDTFIRQGKSIILNNPSRFQKKIINKTGCLSIEYKSEPYNKESYNMNKVDEEIKADNEIKENDQIKSNLDKMSNRNINENSKFLNKEIKSNLAEVNLKPINTPNSKTNNIDNNSQQFLSIINDQNQVIEYLIGNINGLNQSTRGFPNKETQTNSLKNHLNSEKNNKIEKLNEITVKQNYKDKSTEDKNDNKFVFKNMNRGFVNDPTNTDSNRQETLLDSGQNSKEIDKGQSKKSDTPIDQPFIPTQSKLKNNFIKFERVNIYKHMNDIHKDNDSVSSNPIKIFPINNGIVQGTNEEYKNYEIDEKKLIFEPSFPLKIQIKARKSKYNMLQISPANSEYYSEDENHNKMNKMFSGNSNYSKRISYRLSNNISIKEPLKINSKEEIYNISNNFSEDNKS